jgi:NAD(P)-dependent dehydrogenase (short-subunit alcohol dehydrogenase family)
MYKMDGKVALVTGGNSGMGRATAELFSRNGVKVVVAARRVKEGEDTVQAIKDAGGEAIFIRTDVAEPAQIKQLFRDAIEAYGRLDYAFNNAGTEGHTVPLIEQSEADVDYTLNVNTKAVWLCMKLEIEQMLKQGGGAIVNTTSLFGLRAAPNFSIYAASKHAVIGLTKAAALEYAESNIRVNAVAPGPIETELLRRAFGGDPHKLAPGVPMGHIGQPMVIAETVVWLCSDAASFITGHTLPVDGGVMAQ